MEIECGISRIRTCSPRNQNVIGYTTTPQWIRLQDSYVYVSHIYSDKPNSKQKLVPFWVSADHYCQCLTLITTVYNVFREVLT